MSESFVRPESWINEVLRINSLFGGINELDFGYSLLISLYQMEKPSITKESMNLLLLKSINKK